MSVRKRTRVDAKGETVTVWIVDYRDQDRHRHIETYAQKKLADARHAEIKVDVRAGTHVPIFSSITVAEAAEIWIKAVEVGRNGRSPAEASTLRQYRAHLAHILPLLGPVKVANLPAPRVAEFRDQLLGKMSRALAKKVLSSLKGIIGEAQVRGLVKVNAAASVKIATGGRHEAELEIPTVQEVKTLLSKLNEFATQPNPRRAKAWRRWRVLIATAIDTGMRASELRGLPWDAVDLKAGTITVRQRADENGKIGPTKSRAGRRTIYISPALVDLLRHWKLESGTALVFATGEGKPERLANISSRAWRPLQLAAGVVSTLKDEQARTQYDGQGRPLCQPRYNFHSLRHYRASRLIADGANMKEVQQELGHASPVITLSTYAHLLRGDDEDRRRRERAERLASGNREI
jgi:integrase